MGDGGRILGLCSPPPPPESCCLFTKIRASTRTLALNLLKDAVTNLALAGAGAPCSQCPSLPLPPRLQLSSRTPPLCLQSRAYSCSSLILSGCPYPRPAAAGVFQQSMRWLHAGNPEDAFAGLLTCEPEAAFAEQQSRKQFWR